jgi:ATP-dependent DNA helicase 2 subunit 2
MHLYPICHFTSTDTDNIINERNGGYDNVSEYISIGQPSATTLSKLDLLEPSEVVGDRRSLLFFPQTFAYASHTAIDALIVAIETQAEYLSSKKTWTRKIVLLTDGENHIEIEDWEATVKKMKALNVHLTIMYVSSYRGTSLTRSYFRGVDFDDDELPYHEENKSDIKVHLILSASM